MLSLIRRLINSKVGLFITFAFLAIIGLAFAAGDISGINGQAGAPTGDTVATVGKHKLTETDLRQRAENEMENFRQQQPGLDIVTFVNAGGLDGALNRMINNFAMEQFGQSQGMVVSKRVVDGQIASIPGLQGLDGKFSPQIYQQLLQQKRLTDAQIRADIARETLTQQLTFPMGRASQVPQQLALPYASLLLEKRHGEVGFIPTQAMGEGVAPTDAEVATFYKRNIARYTIPERRAIRYAIVTHDQLTASTTPTEAEIAAAYQAQRAKYAATEKRTLVQVIVADQAAATALAAKVKAGTSIEAAARAAGLEPATLTGVEKAAYAGQSSTALADAAFGAAQGAVVGPLRSSLGFTIVRVDGIEKIPGKTLEQAKAELVPALTKEKTTQALGKIHDAIDDAVSAKATFDELIAGQKLTAKSTPPLLSDGRNPDDATVKAAPDFLPVVAAAFAVEQGDSPQMVPIDQEGGFAVVALERIVPAAAPPLTQIRAAVARDFAIDRARRAARQVAATIVAKVNKGMPVTQAFAESGVKTPPVQKLDASRAQLAAAGRQVPPPVALMFSMTEKSAKLLELSENQGWSIVYLRQIERGNAASQPNIVAATRNDLGKVIGREYVEQFSQAVRAQVGVKKNGKAFDAVKAALTGQSSAN
ncbi:peptidylprolyl isomerase [Sphingomonas sp. So64.6b]|uniref:peptidylprolyl isomerase n=1 Tax=Sphingomonas sp. So64.6b TaxID=2997354 RepID=UPI0015FEC85D|nr:peptidylprolyl isomerase [Sphingomonas sp. So64.6b]QNA84266.1 peptidylprolyl isomerase [Sphingomonas sp. So64.6b]